MRACDAADLRPRGELALAGRAVVPVGEETGRARGRPTVAFVDKVTPRAVGDEGSSLALSRDKSEKPCKWVCPTPVATRAFELSTGERLPIACGRNRCAVCRRRNVMVTAAMLGLDAGLGEAPAYVLLTTTERWLADWQLRRVNEEFVRRVRREISAAFEYAWLREWTSGEAPTSGGVRRTHYHWPCKGIRREHGAGLARVASEVWAKRAGAPVVGVKPVWDAAGLGRYLAGLVGHHLKAEQAPPPGWSGRRFGASRGYYSLPAAELRARAEELVREARLVGRLERELVRLGYDGREWPDWLDGPWADAFVDALEDEYVRAIRQPPPRVVRVPYDYWQRQAA